MKIQTRFVCFNKSEIRLWLPAQTGPNDLLQITEEEQQVKL